VTVVDAIDTHLATYPESPIILDLFGTHDADAIRARARELDREAEDVFFFAASVGALFGIRRRDGSRVAMKLHKLYDDERFLDDMQAAQGALADAGFPAPRPLGRRGLVTWEEWLDEGSFRDAHEPAVRRALASTLARFVSLSSSIGVWPRRPFFPHCVEALWPKPHNALFDFEASVEGAEWIDEIARAAQTARATRTGPSSTFASTRSSTSTHGRHPGSRSRSSQTTRMRAARRSPRTSAARLTALRCTSARTQHAARGPTRASGTASPSRRSRTPCSSGRERGSRAGRSG
jgi:hypothetical protein